MHQTIEEALKDCEKKGDKFYQNLFMLITREKAEYKDYKNIRTELAELVAILKFHKFTKKEAGKLFKESIDKALESPK